MSYEIQFRGRDLPSAVVSSDRGEKIKEIWFDMNRQNDHIDIDGNGYVVRDIKGFRWVADHITPAVRSYSQQSIMAGKVCTAEYSIQREINMIAQSESPKGWTKIIGDKQWREKTRRELWKLSDKWCDSVKKTCACDGLSKSKQEAA